MSQTFCKVWLHIIWATKNRLKILDEELIKKLYFHLKHLSKNLGIHLDIINGINDHVHCLLWINTKYSISWLLHKFKGESSHWINKNKLRTKFQWQKGYSVFSVSQSQVQSELS